LAGPGGYGGGVLLPVSNPKDRVRQEILDQTARNQQLQAQLLGRLKELSDDQAFRLTKDQNLMNQWMRQ
jgi:hypothetical protein